MKKTKNFLKQNYKACWKFLKDSADFQIISLGIFCGFVILGFAFPFFFEQQILNFLKRILLKVEGMNFLKTFLFIFFNNLKASFFAIVLGVGAGIFPVITGIANGYLLGFVARYAASKEGIFVLWRLLPHGIFELPALIISVGFGLKIGLEIWKKDSKKILKKNLKESMRFFIFVILPLLVVAAAIESLLIFFGG